MIFTILLFTLYCFFAMFLTIVFHELGHIIILKAFKIPVKINWSRHHISLSENKLLKKLPKPHLLYIYHMGIMTGAVALVSCLGWIYHLKSPFNILFVVFLLIWFWIYWFYGCRSDWKNIAWCLNTKK